MSDEESGRVRAALRLMAWERAKGELNAILQTYWGEGGYHEMDKAVRAFIKKVEDNDWVN